MKPVGVEECGDVIVPPQVSAVSAGRRMIDMKATVRPPFLERLMKLNTVTGGYVQGTGTYVDRRDGEYACIHATADRASVALFFSHDEENCYELYLGTPVEVTNRVYVWAMSDSL